MQDECELRFDIPLPAQCTPAQFEKNWRDALASQKMTALAMPPAEAVGARYRVYGAAGDESLARYLPVRLAALPGAPPVVAEPADAGAGWQGVRVWLSYRAQDLPGLLQRARVSGRAPFPFSRGRRS